MDRFSFRLVCALSASVGCAQDLKCYEGAVEINGVCECPSGTTYVRALDSCQDSDGVLDDGGTTDASVSPLEGTELDAKVRDRDARAGNARDGAVDAAADARSGADGAAQVGPAPARDAGGVRADAAPTPPPRCPEEQLMCGEICVDPRNDRAHCGGCAACNAGSTCLNGNCVETGCSDATREAFVDLAKFPTLAGCAATWSASSMRAERKLPRCGDGSAACEVPLDACAAGWHVCGNSEDNAVDITSRLAQPDCAAQKGRFAAAVGDQSCTPCSADGSGAACCGDDCVQQQGSCLWPMATAWFGVRQGVLQRCGAIANPTPSPAIGVMCCRDGK